MGTLGDVGLSLSIVVGIGLALMLTVPSQLPRVAHVPPERRQPVVVQRPVNDFAGSVAADVYAHGRQAVSVAVKAVKHAVREVRRHRKAVWSVWANRRGYVWPTMAFDEKSGHRARHDGTQEMISCT